MANKRPLYAPWLCYLHLVIFSTVYYIYNLAFVNFLLAHPQIQIPFWARNIYHLVFKFFWFMTLWSILAIVTSNIKVPNKRFKLSQEYQDRYNSTEDIKERNQVLLEYANQQQLKVVAEQKVLVPGEESVSCLGYCSRCSAIIPNRAQHCTLCEVCVLLQDHHCAATAVCINFGNFKAFLCFLGYFCCLSITTVATIAPHIGTIWSGASDRTTGYIVQAVLVTALLGYGGMFTFYMGGFLIFYLYNLSRNKTMTDLDGPCHLSYDQGSRMENWRQLFGSNPFFWPLPLNTTQGDGYTFKCKQVKF